jgi:uncharacterized protein
MALSGKSASFLIDSRMADAAYGDTNALYEDLVQAHKWFNLAALRGNERGQECRAEIADDMTAREIAEAQRQARAWLNETTRHAA